MDFFGIGAAVKGAMNVYFQSARRTGRTTSMLETLKDGDRVYFACQQDARNFDRLCKERGRGVECLVIDPKEPQSIFHRHGTCSGRAIFDHSWLEQFYQHGLEQMQEHVACLERESSGWSEVHEQTKLKAQELAKWQR